ncbi:hypothetical protein QYF36_003260 [Acer negundo]|nr:hypothetical protein QYF36_003260 [Acer negundo]
MQYVSNVDSTSQVQTQTLVASDCRDSSNQIKPWNLRSSRKDQDRASANAPVKAQLPFHESAQLGFDAEMTMEKRKRSSFSIALTKEEIEADLLAITGSKQTSRPKKRRKNVQRQLDNLFPGLCLKSIIFLQDTVKVPYRRRNSVCAIKQTALIDLSDQNIQAGGGRDQHVSNFFCGVSVSVRAVTAISMALRCITLSQSPTLRLERRIGSALDLVFNFHKLQLNAK